LARNLNLLVREARGELFQWFSDDDLMAPELLAATVAALDGAPDAPLSHSRITVIDESGTPGRTLDPAPGSRSEDVAERLEALLWEPSCLQMFGLIRRHRLLATPLIGPYAHADGVLLVRLAMMGRFVPVPSALFFYREHGGQSVVLARERYDRFSEWFDPSRKGEIFFPWWRIAGEFARAIATELPAHPHAGRTLWTYIRWLVAHRVHLGRDVGRATRRVLRDDF
jgi:hypothetical protein